MIRRVVILLVLAASLWHTPHAHAQSVRVTASVQPTRVYVGDSATYTITVHEGEAQAAPTVDGIPGLRVQYATSSTQQRMESINGRMTTSRSQSLQYSATPARPGEYVIPAQTVEVGGRRYTTGEVRLVAEEPPVSELSPLSIQPERERVYVGEPVRLSSTWRIGENIEGFRFMTEDQDGIQWTDGPQPRATRGTVDVRWDNDRLVGVVGSTTTREGTFQTLNVERWFIPLRAGELELGPVTVVYDAQVGTRGRGIFRGAETERRVARSNTPTLTVMALPDEGRPEGFTDLVGRYTASAEAAPIRVRVGDPITLTYEIRSDGPMGRVDAPDLASDPGFAESFKLDPEGWRTTAREPGLRRYTTTIRALRDSIDRVPALGFQYFDTESEEYRLAASAPIPLAVEATREVTAEDAVGGGGPGRAPVERTELGAGPGGVLANATSPDALVDQQTLFLERLRNPVWGVALVAPPVGYFALLGVIALRRTSDPVSRRRAGAGRAALSRLKSKGDVEGAIRTYLAMKFDRRAEALTEADCRRLLSGADPGAVDKLARAMLNGASGRYGGSDGAPPDPTRIADLLRSVDREVGR